MQFYFHLYYTMKAPSRFVNLLLHVSSEEVGVLVGHEVHGSPVDQQHLHGAALEAVQHQGRQGLVASGNPVGEAGEEGDDNEKLQTSGECSRHGGYRRPWLSSIRSSAGWVRQCFVFPSINTKNSVNCRQKWREECHFVWLKKYKTRQGVHTWKPQFPVWQRLNIIMFEIP